MLQDTFVIKKLKLFQNVNICCNIVYEIVSTRKINFPKRQLCTIIQRDGHVF